MVTSMYSETKVTTLIHTNIESQKPNLFTLRVSRNSRRFEIR